METPNFTGYWVLSKIENLDEFLRALGFPWIIRKAALRFGSSAVDLIRHEQPSVVHVTSLNAKGSWTRKYDVHRVVSQEDALGDVCRTTTWWEGNVLRTKLEGGRFGECDSWRFLRGNIMILKTTVKPTQGTESSCFWFFERMEALESHLGSGSQSQLLHAIKKDQKRVSQATKRDTKHLQKIILDIDKWMSPADEFIVLGPGYANSPRSVSSSGTGHYVSRGKGKSASAGRLQSATSPNSSPFELSKSPSNQSLGRLPSDTDLSRQKSSVLNGGTSDRVASLHSAQSGGISRAENRSPPPFVQEIEASSSVSAIDQEGETIQKSSSTSSMKALTRAQQKGLATGTGVNHGNKVTGGTSMQSIPLQQHPPIPPGPSSSSLLHHRLRPIDISPNAAGNIAYSRRPVHYRSPSAESIPSNFSQATPLNSPSHASQKAPSGPEAHMVFKLKEYLDSRGIISVVPVTSPNDTREPELLAMSPEQAEDTSAQLRELETDLLLKRQGSAKGWDCCGLIIQWKADTLPDHLRVWEMTLA